MSTKNPQIRTLRAIAGFSLVELLIATTIGLILTSGMIAVFSGNKRSSDMNTAMANIQENARFAINAVASDIRIAGFQGCIDINEHSVDSISQHAPTLGLKLSSTVTSGAVISDDGGWYPNLPQEIGFSMPADNAAVPGTHALMLQFGHAAGQVPLSGVMSDGTRPSQAGDVPLERPILGVAEGDFVIVSNCELGDLFQVTSLGTDGTKLGHAAGRNNSANLQVAYGNDLTLSHTKAMKFHSNIYYIGKTGLTNEDGSEVTALFQRGLPYDDSNPPTELIQGVENMRVAFGMRSDRGHLRYVTPDDPDFQPREVEAVRLGLLMSSWDSITENEDDSTYMLAGQPIIPEGTTSTDATAGTHPGDKRFRLAFNTTIKVRNRRNKE